MKTKITLVLLLLTQLASAQYTISTKTGTERPQSFTGQFDNVLLSETQNDVLSTWQTLPFNFQFYGQTVTGYYASDNGYITFDQAATVSYNNNTAIPNTSGPNNAIYAFWDDFYLDGNSSTEDLVLNLTLGIAPNRVHIISWRSLTHASASGSFYFSIRLFECGGFEILHAQGSTGSGTIGAEDATGSIANAINSSPNAMFNNIDVTDDTDDKVYLFRESTSSLDIDISLPKVKTNYTAASNESFKALITNKGTSPINSFNLHYAINNGTPKTMSVSGQNITTGNSNLYTHNAAWNVPNTAGHYEIKVWVNNINGSASDDKSCNNEITVDVAVSNGQSGTKRVLIEEFTGAWCGYCVDGTAELKQIEQDNNGQVDIVSIHHADAMDFSEKMRIAFNVFGFPKAVVDRAVLNVSSFSDDELLFSTDWAAATASRLSSSTPANITTNYTYDSNNRTYTITMQTTFVDYAAGNFRMIPIILEDSVTGLGSGYNQVNYGNLYNGVSPIIGYVHNDVLRDYPAGAFGLEGTIPYKNSPNDTYTETFTYTLPNNFDENQIRILGALVQVDKNTLNREVLNTSGGLFTNTGVVNLPKLAHKVYPNPIQNYQFQLEIEKNNAENWQLDIYNVLGQSVHNELIINNISTIELNDNLPSGQYFYTIRNENGQTVANGKLMK